MDLFGKRVLVIGGAGLIGSTTIDALLATEVAEIRVFDNFVRGRMENLKGALADPRVNVFPHGGDILQSDILNRAMEGMDGVFDFAALWLLHCQDYPRSAFEVNIGGTFNVLEAMRKNGVKRLVYSSSASVYGNAVYEPMDEDHPLNQRDFYGATKAASEDLIRGMNQLDRGSDDNFEYVCLRYMNVYGPRQDYKGAYIAVMMNMLDRIDRGLQPRITGSATSGYDFVYVGDCARANVAAMTANVSGGSYNVGTGIKTTLKELGELILELTDSDLGLDFEDAPRSYVTSRVAATARAANDLDFVASVELREGLAKLIAWRESDMVKDVRELAYQK